jgi:hypothetical protein
MGYSRTGKASPYAPSKELRRWSTFEDACRQYKAVTGKIPKEDQLLRVYHAYRGMWESFRNFAEYMQFAEVR